MPCRRPLSLCASTGWVLFLFFKTHIAPLFCRAAFEFVRKHGLDAVRVLRLPRNRGKGAAVRSGCLCARGQRVLFMDADGATQVSGPRLSAE